MFYFYFQMSNSIFAGLFNVLVPFLLTRFDNLVHIVMPMNNYT